MSDLGNVGKQLGAEPLIKLAGVHKAFPANSPRGMPVAVLEDFSLTLGEHELVTIFGPNGCGKTTVLNILAGLSQPDSGTVSRIDTDDGAPSVGYVFQNYADTLLPWRTVRKNIQLPLELRGFPKMERTALVDASLSRFHLSEHSEKYIYELSGGLKQLVSIARSTIYRPKLLLLDEPFSALDFSLSRGLWRQFRRFWAGERVPTVFVSHNVDEAVFLGDRVIVLSARPARVIADISVPFGVDRDLDLVTSSEFFSVRSAVIGAFEGGRSL